MLLPWWSTAARRSRWLVLVWSPMPSGSASHENAATRRRAADGQQATLVRVGKAANRRWTFVMATTWRPGVVLGIHHNPSWCCWYGWDSPSSGWYWPPDSAPAADLNTTPFTHQPPARGAGRPRNRRPAGRRSTPMRRRPGVLGRAGGPSGPLGRAGGPSGPLAATQQLISLARLLCATACLRSRLLVGPVAWSREHW
jgi:hypothetical protein